MHAGIAVVDDVRRRIDIDALGKTPDVELAPRHFVFPEEQRIRIVNRAVKANPRQLLDLRDRHLVFGVVEGLSSAYVLERVRVLKNEKGAHIELIRGDGLYAKLYGTLQH